MSEWRAYFELEPFGPLQEDYQAGIVATILANSNRDPKKRRNPYTPQDFFPSLAAEQEQRTLELAAGQETYVTHDGQTKVKQTWQQMLATVVTINQAHKGLDLRQVVPNGDSS